MDWLIDLLIAVLTARPNRKVNMSQLTDWLHNARELRKTRFLHSPITQAVQADVLIPLYYLERPRRPEGDKSRTKLTVKTRESHVISHHWLFCRYQINILYNTLNRLQ